MSKKRIDPEGERRHHFAERASRIEWEIMGQVGMLTPLGAKLADKVNLRSVICWALDAHHQPEAKSTLPMHLPVSVKKGPISVNGFSTEVTYGISSEKVAEGSKVSLEPDEGENRFFLSVQLERTLFFEISIIFTKGA